MFKPEDGVRYDMPVVFGPSRMPARTRYGGRRTIAHSFLTDPAAIEPFVPYHFTLAEPARITVAGRMHLGVDWLAGRGYNSVRVSVDLEARHGGETIRGPYGLVIWESDPRPAIVGREYLGTSKIVGEIPDHEQGPATAAFECHEYGTRLLRVDVSQVTPVDEATLAEHNSGGDSVTLCWKYIPGPRGTVDADYPLKNVARGDLDAMWTGTSALTFGRPTWEQCPISHRIIEMLSALPVLEVLPATLTTASGSYLDRGATARLD